MNGLCLSEWAHTLTTLDLLRLREVGFIVKGHTLTEVIARTQEGHLTPLDPHTVRLMAARFQGVLSETTALSLVRFDRHWEARLRLPGQWQPVTVRLFVSEQGQGLFWDCSVLEWDTAFRFQSPRPLGITVALALGRLSEEDAALMRPFVEALSSWALFFQSHPEAVRWRGWLLPPTLSTLLSFDVVKALIEDTQTRAAILCEEDRARGCALALSALGSPPCATSHNALRAHLERMTLAFWPTQKGKLDAHDLE
jgi:hypothetical protein